MASEKALWLGLLVGWACPLAEGEFTWAEWSSPAFVRLFQQMADVAAEPSFKVAPTEQTGSGDDPTHIEVEMVVDFDLPSPPL